MAKKNFKQIWKENFHFISLLVVFAGFALYAVFSFFVLNDRYLGYVSVVDSQSRPPVCQTCPPIEMCTEYCSGGGSVNDDDEDDDNDDDSGSQVDSDDDDNDDDNDDDSSETYEIFSDVKSDNEFGEYVESLKDKGIVGGYKDGSFKPDGKINRAELLKLLAVAVKADLEMESLVGCFPDVKTEWFASYICYGKGAGWVSGFKDGSYKPAQDVTKAAALKMILEALEFDLPETVTEKPFNDVPVDSWFAPYVIVAKENGIVKTAENFEPNHEVSRAEFSKMLYKAMVIQDLL